MDTLPNFESSLKELIASTSISSMRPEWDHGNLGVIQLLATWFEQLGFCIEIQPVPDTNNKFNLLASIGSGEGGLLIAGHSDTVPFDEKKWQTDPMKIAVKDDRFYGLGTCDMKGFFAFVLQVCRQIPKKSLKKPLYILATADEETTMAGARFFAEQKRIAPELAIIGEPTSLVPVVMHKGHMSHRISIEGQSGHSSNPDLGVNAIEIMYQVIGKLITLKEKLNKKFTNASFNVQSPTLNMGAIKGGDNANRICGHCELDLDMRSLPGMTDAQLIDMLSEALAPLKLQYPNRIFCRELHASSPSFEQKTPSRIVSLAEEISGSKCCAVNYATEAPFIQQLGCQTIVIGPGSIDQAHQPNEFLAFDQVDKTMLLLQSLIEKTCL